MFPSGLDAKRDVATVLNTDVVFLRPSEGPPCQTLGGLRTGVRTSHTRAGNEAHRRWPKHKCRARPSAEICRFDTPVRTDPDHRTSFSVPARAASADERDCEAQPRRRRSAGG